MEKPIAVLRIDHNAITKELSRFRACDIETRCYYCREWTQYVYRKHFVWSAKTQEDVSMEGTEAICAGRYQINVMNGEIPAKQKERSPKLSERFEMLLESSTESRGDVTLTEDIIAACMLWQTLPSSLYALPPIFEPIQFNPYPDAIPLIDDPKEPSHLLDPLIIERQSLALPADGFHLLKNLTGEIILSHTQATCNHTRPEFKSPADLEMEKDMHNEKLQGVTKTALAELEKALNHAWRFLSDFLNRLTDLEKERNRLMGKRCKDEADQFAADQKLQPFAEFWSAAQINQKLFTTAESIDARVHEFLNQQIQAAESFQTTFAIPRLEALRELIQALWDLVVPTIQHMADRMASHEQQDERHMENCKAVSASLRDLHPADDVDVAVKRILGELARRVEEMKQESQDILTSLKEDTRCTVSSRLDKLNRKDFKKRIKRFENIYSSLRQYFKFEVSEKIFPEPLFCKFCLVCIEALMQEGEVMEAVTIENEVKRFLEAHQDLVKKRQELLDDFENGVQKGRRELSGVFGKLFLKEGMRIQGENLAVRRQNSLLSSMGDLRCDDTPDGGSGKKKKNKKKKKKNGGNPAAASVATDSQPPSVSSSPKLTQQTSHPPPESISNTEPTAVQQDEPQKTSKEQSTEPVKPIQTKEKIDNKAEVLARAGADEEKQNGEKNGQQSVTLASSSTSRNSPVNSQTRKMSPEKVPVSKPEPNHTNTPKNPAKVADISVTTETLANNTDSHPATVKEVSNHSEKAQGQVNHVLETEAKPPMAQSSSVPTNKVEPSVKQVPLVTQNTDSAPHDQKANNEVAAPWPNRESTQSLVTNDQPITSFTPTKSDRWHTPDVLNGVSALSGSKQASWNPLGGTMGGGANWVDSKLSSDWPNQASWHPSGTSLEPPTAGWIHSEHPWHKPHTPQGVQIMSPTPVLQNVDTQNYGALGVSDNLQDIDHNGLASLVRSLRQENEQLIQHMTAMRHEMALLNRRYAETLTLSREREAQVAQAYETRRRSDMEEMRRYIMSLEGYLLENAKDAPLKPPLLSGAPGSGMTAGFGNQDLFAGYREEMCSNHNNKRLWQKNAAVHCGNCGLAGHTSTECKDVCRYCGSGDHLSESCHFV